MLEVTIAEIDRTVFRGLDVNFNTLRPSSQVAFGALSGGGSLAPIISGGTVLTLNQHSIDAAGVFLSAVSGSFI
jgi:Flp pilus assembly secretin CpaC